MGEITGDLLTRHNNTAKSLKVAWPGGAWNSIIFSSLIIAKP